jgi:peptide deformylase
MTVRELRLFPDPTLREPCRQVNFFDEDLARLLDDLGESMYAHQGVGLAAPQIGETVRAIVVDVAQKEGTPHLIELVNPEIVDASTEREYREEGCLSFPEESEKVTRSVRITVRALDRKGHPFELTGQGLLSVALQHEMDHLDGVLFVDHLSSLKRSLVVRRMKKRSRKQKSP